MTFYPARPDAIASRGFDGYEEMLDEVSSRASAGRTWSEPIPVEHIEFLARNFARGHFVIAPILDPQQVVVSANMATFVATPAHLDRLRDGDVVLATRLTDPCRPVHSIGSITTEKVSGGRVIEFDGERVTRFALNRGRLDGTALTFDTYQEAFDEGVARAAEDPFANYRVTAQIFAGTSATLASIDGAAVNVTAELAIVNFDDHTRIVGFEVVEGVARA